MQISSVSNSSPVYDAYTTQNVAPRKDSTSSTPVDTVHLSPAAQAHAAGDVDHDGDSH